jgi:hypothetical protein
METPKSRVERHGRLILAIFLVGSFVGLLMLTDGILGARAAKPEIYTPSGKPKLERSLRIREWNPGSVVETLPPRRCVEGIEDKVYRADIDASGFIAPSHVHAEPELTIAFFGGSTTECLFMAPEERFAYAVGRELEAKTGKRTNSLNAGRSGNHTLHSVTQLLGKGVPEKPRIAVNHEAINDLNILLYYGTYWNQNGSRSLVVDRLRVEELPPKPRRAGLELLESLVPNVYAALTKGGGEGRDEFADVRGKKLVWDRAALLAEFERAQRAFVATARVFGITPVLLTQASLLTEAPRDVVLCDKGDLFAMGIDYGTYRGLHQAVNEVTRQVARAEGVALVDLEARVPQDPRFFYDTVHYTPAGSRLVTQWVSEALLRVLEAPSPQKDSAP